MARKNDTVDEIRTLEDARYAAMLQADMPALERLLHPDLLYMHSSGVSDTKSSYMAGLKAAIGNYQRIERVDQTIKVQPHVAFVFNRLLLDILVRGAPRQLDNRALAVWVKDACAAFARHARLLTDHRREIKFDLDGSCSEKDRANDGENKT